MMVNYLVVIDNVNENVINWDEILMVEYCD